MFASMHTSLQQEEYRWSLLAGSSGGLELSHGFFNKALSFHFFKLVDGHF